MRYQIENRPKDIKADNTPNPVYGPMGIKVTPTGSDSWEMQHRQAMIPDRRIIENRPIYVKNSGPVPVDLTPIRKMDDLR